ncbi:hypothetical protein CARUB_v10022724mg [Capsella rubella]|uniref:J domain-containing protein n=1 Tax=Capsella rubella TaxID=81985 RepID=R0HRN9_9BRAS|nr:uncharacterized protein LOC17889070 [Capsella rubella]EOA26658.1 hypothetical protein CARUB_v10022724mg [Capsella rubella]
MDCNKEEAIRAREIAKKKFLGNDLSGARKFAMKAQFLYPYLDGIDQMVATFDVHLSAQNIIFGEKDYYGVLGLNPEADYETVRKRYKKLAVLLHPDRNKSIGAEEAFKFLSQAWGVFSDDAKRADYDLKRNMGLHEGRKASSSSRPATNGFQKVTKASGNTTKVKSSKRGIKRASDAVAAKGINRASDGVAARGINRASDAVAARGINRASDAVAARGINRGGDAVAARGINRASEAVAARGINRASDAVAAAAATSTSAQKTTGDGTFWTVCRTCRTQYEYHRVYLNQNLLCPNCRKPFIAVETDPPGSGSIRKTFHEHQFDSLRHTTDGRKKNVSGKDSNGVYGEYDSFEWGVSTGTKNAAQTGSRKEEVVRREYNKRAAGVSSTIPPKRRKVMENAVAGTNIASSPKPTGVKEVSEDELKNLLKNKAKSVLRRNLQELRTNAVETDSKEREMETEDLNGFNADSSVNKNSIESSSMGSIMDSLGALTIEVPDPDFRDFDKDRTERSFRDDQIWATYDSLEGMPRSYVVINNVISVDPFKVRMSWLTSVANGELNSTNWLGSGVPKSCGEFRVGKTQISKSPYIFSHKVNLVKGNNGEFLIYPRTGEVWALYQKWSPEWNYLTGSETVEYELVEVVEGYTKEHGVSVVPLVKVAGFKAVFRHHLDPKKARRIHRNEISRFSHKIPSKLLTGREASGAPRGCRQLDPAATPSQHLQVIDDHQ